MDRERAMAANCEAEFGSCNRDISVNQAHNQQRGKTRRGAKTATGKLNTSVRLLPLPLLLSPLRLCSPSMTCPYIQFL